MARRPNTTPPPADLPSSPSSPSPQDHLDPTHWAYLAEGKLHVLLSYHGDQPCFHNHVLRLLKERHPGEEKAHYDPSHERDYILRVVGPALGHQYLDGGVSLTVPPSFLAAIAEQIRPHRPARRAVYGLDLDACTVECLRDLTRFFPPPSSPPSSSSSPSPPRLTLELKPKAGYTSRSRLVPPAHRFKYHESRFHLMQSYRYALQQSQALEPEWGKLEGSPNLAYSPLDLFSGDRERMTRALKALVRNPQNFCQVFVDSQVVFGRGEGEVGLAREAARELLCVSCEEGGDGEEDEEDEEEDWLEVLMEAVALVLEQEPLLRRVREVQAMDVLDIEGAGMVMRRLIALCEGQERGREGGGEEEALALLEVAELRGLSCCERGGDEDGEEDEDEEGREDGGRSLSAMLRRLEEMMLVMIPPNPLEEGGSHDESRTNADDNDDDREDEDEDEDEAAAADGHGHQSLDTQHAQAMAAVQQLTRDECVLLLQRWLISLGACDCSIMLSLRRHHPFPPSLPSSSTSDGANSHHHTDMRCPSPLPSQGHRQTATSPGLIYFQPQPRALTVTGGVCGCSSSSNRSSRTSSDEQTEKQGKSQAAVAALSYFMHVVDHGPKPPSKILSKAAMETEIIAVAGRGGGGKEGFGNCKGAAAAAAEAAAAALPTEQM